MNEKLMEVLTSPPDGAITIVTQGTNEPHIANTWNSYVEVTEEGKWLIPAGGMDDTEGNIKRNNRVQLSVANRDVQGKMYKGAGFLVRGTADFQKEGPDFDRVKARFPWARAALIVTIENAVETL